MKYLYIIDSKCYKCNSPIKVSLIIDEDKETNRFYGPENFTEKEIKIAEENGCILKNHFSNTIKNTYLANTCSKCNAFIGEFYLMDDYYLQIDYYKSTKITMEK